MRVRCITNDVCKLSNTVVKKRLAKSIQREGADEDLIVDSTYDVLAIDRWSDGGIRVYLHTVEENDYPYPYPIEMFEFIDSALPAGWCLVFEQQPLGMGIKRASFPEWANDDYFYEKLVDGDEAAIAIYKHHKTP